VNRMCEVAERDGKGMLELLRHAIGADKRGAVFAWRNQFCVTVDEEHESPNEVQWCLLVGLGLAYAGRTINDGSSRYFHVSEAGLAFLQAHRKQARP
jgi:hypothetical protein